MPESLIREWEKVDVKGINSAVLLIDEQGDFSVPQQPMLLANQGAILQLVDQFQHAFAYFIELNPSLGNAKPLPALPTNPELRLCVKTPSKAVTMEKQYFSAFDGTNLHSSLREKKVQTLIVMGHVAGHCVKQTIFGGPRDRQGTIIANGAINFGYNVLSSQAVVSGKINWKKNNNVVLCDII